MLKIRYSFFGRMDGNFGVDEYIDELFPIVKGKMGPVFAPRANFTNRIVEMGEEDFPISQWIIGTRNEADGGIVSKPDQRIVLFNADCPLVAVLDQQTERFAALHAGFRCIIREIPKRSKAPRGPSIIHELFTRHKFSPNTSKAFVGFGIGPCCYGAAHWEEAKDLTFKFPVGRATRGSRCGQISFDLYTIIRSQLLEVGLREANISIYNRCTSCEMTDFPATLAYYSRCRDGPNKGRNAALFWFTK
ncbi:MAG: polyphenol oxidase family protein [Candidatus Harrisonbacteria bacterium]|nr:polyphenol oxidase family protein [Candidatus Harrisonbacteria bacterium]